MEAIEKINTLKSAFVELRSAGVVKTQGDFAQLLGITLTSLSAARNGDSRYLTDSLMDRVASVMKKQTEGLPSDQLLVIPTGARAGTLGDFADQVREYECERIVSPIRGADFAMQVAGDSMSPEYPSGSLIIIKKVNEQAFIEWGKVYVLDTDNGAVVKQIRKTANPNVVECVSLNPAYQPFTIDTKFVRGWYRVLMSLSMK